MSSKLYALYRVQINICKILLVVGKITFADILEFVTLCKCFKFFLIFEQHEIYVLFF